MINIFQPSLGKEELDAVEKVFESNWIGKGEWVSQFEKGFAQHLRVDSDHFTSTTSCSEAIFLAPKLFHFAGNDEIIAPGISFVAVGSAVGMSGAKLILCDVDRRSLNARAGDIERKITRKTKAIFLNHYGGVSCDMDPIMELCEQNNIIVIEDSACATKSFYKGKACGTIGDMGMWSFGAMKVICCGDGGMIYLRSKDLIGVANELLYHGFPSRQKSGMDGSKTGSPNWWEIDISRLGRRAFMNNISGAIGVSQLKKMDRFILRKKYIYEIFMKELADCQWLTLPPVLNEEYVSSYYFFWIQLEKRDELARFLLDHGVYSTYRYWPLHKIKYFKQEKADLPNSDFVSQYTLNIPLHQSLSDADVFKIIELIKEFGKE
jgi:aminotransferase